MAHEARPNALIEQLSNILVEVYFRRCFFSVRLFFRGVCFPDHNRVVFFSVGFSPKSELEDVKILEVKNYVFFNFSLFPLVQP